MKKSRLILWLSVLCLLLSACQTAQPAQDADGTTRCGQFTEPEPSGIPVPPDLSDETLAFRNPGKQRITYTSSQSSVLYITSASQLPKNNAFKQYDDAFFQEHALVLVTQTVGSGSVQLAIESISLADGAATVTLSHSLPGDAGTTDMATWYLWVEVDAGLDLEWKLKGITKNDSLEVHTH